MKRYSLAIYPKAIVHHGATLLPNNKIQTGTISHVRQFYIAPRLLQMIKATNS